MARGGKRLGSGRKPLKRSERWLRGNAGKVDLALVTSRPEVVPARDAGVVLSDDDVPAVLTEEEAAYYRLWAPLARGRKMLFPETMPGFVQLCQVARRCARLWSEIDRDGLMYEVVTVDGAGQERREYKKHPLMTEWRGLVSRQEQMLARFGLTADGKVAAEVESVDDEEMKLARILAVK